MNHKVMDLERSTRDKLVNQPSKSQDLVIATLQKHRQNIYLIYFTDHRWPGLNIFAGKSTIFLSYLCWLFLTTFSIIYEALRELILPFLSSVAFYTIVYTLISPAFMTSYIFRSLSEFCSGYADLLIPKMKMPGTGLIQMHS